MYVLYTAELESIVERQDMKLHQYMPTIVRFIPLFQLLTHLLPFPSYQHGLRHRSQSVDECQGCARDLPARDRDRDRDRDVQSRDRDRDRDTDNSSETRPRPRPHIDRDETETETFEEGLETFTLTCRWSSLVILSKYQVKYYYSYILYN